MKIIKHRVFLCIATVVLLFFSPVFGDDFTGEVWPSDALTKVLRQALPPGDSAGVLEVSGARGETVSGQAIFRCSQDVADVTASVSVLKHRSSEKFIATDAVQLQWVRYIDIDRNSSGVPEDELVVKAPNSIPDPFWEEINITVKSNEAQPVWLEIDIPYDAVAGDYQGELVVNAGGELFRLPIKMHVWDFEMPKEKHLSIINWVSFPGVTFNKRIKKDTEEYWQFLERLVKFLVKHRQTDLQTNLSMIRKKKIDETETVWDSSLLEKYADVVFGAGLEQIHLHTVAGKTAYILDPNSRIIDYKDNYRRLVALEKLMQRRNWQGRFLIAISDEPFIHHEETFIEVSKRVHEASPSVRIIEACETEYLGELDVYVPKLNHLNLWYRQFDKLREEGKELWFYTCCHPQGRYPNRFLDQSLLKMRVLHWINYLYDIKGYLHWGLNMFYGDDPYTQEAISQGLPLGDRAICYPGKDGWLGSIRYSTQKNGIQDFEYLWVLENELKKIKEKVGAEAFWLEPRQRSLELCKRVIWSFYDYTRDDNLLWRTRKAIAEEIEAMKVEPFLIVQTSPEEGTTIPFGPRHVNVRGLVTPGSKVTVNGKNIVNVRPSGYFLYAYLDDKQPTITITAEFNGKKRTVQRTFKFVD
ncbi:MAG: DUF4091 domain-containing protein [Planctomycetes bacterium]|nr:DUF4091 domain-containing protein [Planctomycetota bacterium]